MVYGPIAYTGPSRRMRFRNQGVISVALIRSRVGRCRIRKGGATQSLQPRRGAGLAAVLGPRPQTAIRPRGGIAKRRTLLRRASCFRRLERAESSGGWRVSTSDPPRDIGTLCTRAARTSIQPIA
jgi:hypothetical protein